MEQSICAMTGASGRGMEDVSTNGSIGFMPQSVITLRLIANLLLGQVGAAVQIPAVQQHCAETISFFVIGQKHALTKVHIYPPY